MKKPILSTSLILSLALFAYGCSQVDPAQVTRPAGTEPFSDPEADLVALGEQYWKDPSLSSSGAISCNTCHLNFAQFRDTFKEPYPHYVRMTNNQAGFDQVTAEEMVQFCMVVPMKAEALPWDSKELAALTAYTKELQKEFANM